MTMKTLFKSTGVSMVMALAAVALIMGGCGGGGGGSSSSDGASGDTGSVGVFLADGPSDDYDHFWIWGRRWPAC